MDKNIKIVLPGAAGLVGQNLIVQLKKQGYTNIIAIDKHHANLETLKSLHPEILAVEADLADKNAVWEEVFEGADVVVMLQAQIGAPTIDPFIRNNVTSTKNVLDVIKQYNIPYLVHISSSVVNSVAEDFYTNTKKEQEKLVVASGIPQCILRPTLMYGWFDRKHLGWLSRFMEKVPFFPIPGHGRYMRQPLYEKDFCNIIISAIQKQPLNQAFNITGRDEVDYIDIIKTIKRVKGLKTPIIKIPYSVFYGLMKFYAVFSKNPPFTTQQLEALVADDKFELIPWWDIFEVDSTPFEKAMYETFNDPTYSKIILEF
ncbi:MAG: NAD-dependent dehydratase [Piscirickettsiaceae bacterium CG_4_9_14_3_um_filter_43_564]|nr:NAD-dependent epimerase/dehydratase family protein [Thiomicrospira sp.]OIP94475.1 MAG: NAD-dependent dehydratase [Thiomicrospira sp. CG2_30_44_34]PIQ04429.1 MAG: NAD-dependent dehydratase [Piscirickettsiaceae bacterium CG18_big_fil_WC_8_21_14_2_50_44_103]PJA66594.1 MAG: NAD-dependent dehydratase [Piscirickettsiaceae bacterium CG_4_9_14_3_um_filter_43_564]NCO14670.1 NAD-dependent epimerase/dehydratase family protein [Thiomicrospira sp.]